MAALIPTDNHEEFNMLRIITALCIASATGSTLAQDIIVLRDDFTHFGTFDVTVPDLTIRALAGRNPVLDANGAGSVIKVNIGNGNITLEGLTIQDGSRIGNNDRGSGVEIVNAELVTIRDCLIRNNDANDFGGGGVGGFNFDLLVENSVFQENNANGGGAILLRDNSSMVIRNSQFIENSARVDAGAIFYEVNANQTLVIEDSDFEGNICNDRGGAILMRDAGQVMITNTRFTENTAIGLPGSDAGAIFIEGVRDTTFNGCDFEANLANGEGGAVLSFLNTPRGDLIEYIDTRFVDHESSASTVSIFGGVVDVVNCDFLDNTTLRAGDGGRIGGALRYRTSQGGQRAFGRVYNSIFDGNSADAGGAVMVGTGTVDIVNSTFVDNIANSGAAIGGLSGCNLRIFNNIFAGHGADAVDLPSGTRETRFNLFGGNETIQGEASNNLINFNPLFVDHDNGLYIVLDGMGGHQGGATASRVARDVMVSTISRGRAHRPPGKLLVEACTAGGLEVHNQAKANRHLHGMGTTVVALTMPRPNQALIAHVGDSRAYLLRKGRLRRLTADHTVVAELVAAGRLTPEQAIDHPHSSVLSRNLGGLPTTEVDLLEVELQVGDRILLCSDGLNGYATRSAIEQVLSGASTPNEATADLIELAKRGGGGDNISAIVVEIDELAPAGNPLSEKSGSAAWWERRPLFLDVCQRMGIATSPLARGLSAGQALDILGGSFCEAVYLDLEGTTGVHVWTYADSLVKPWFDNRGEYPPVKELFDILRAAAMAVVGDVVKVDEDFGVCLEISLLRSLIVGEMVVGAQISECIKEANETFAARAATSDLPDTTFASIATVPSADSPMPAGPEVHRCLSQGHAAARKSLAADDNSALSTIVDAAHASASEFSGEAEMASTALDLYGSRLRTEQEINPLLDALDRARAVHLSAVDAQEVEATARAAALCALAKAHQSLFHAFAMVAVDAGKPTTDRLREMNESTARMREQFARNEQHLAQLETALDTVEDYVP